MYNGIAGFYDRYTADLKHERVADHVERWFKKYGNKGIASVKKLREKAKGGNAPCGLADNTAVNGSDIDNSTLVLDCACGTGALTCILAERGYDMTGLDISQDMLYTAMDTAEEKGLDVLWLCQDMRKMDMYGSFSAVLCMTDGVNHLTAEKQLDAFFGRLFNFIDAGGLLIFDFLTEEYFEKSVGNGVFFEDGEDGTCIWTSRYNPRSAICTYDITVYELCEDGLYTRSDDKVKEKAWSVEAVKRLLKANGFEICEENDGLAQRGRVYIVARRPRNDY